MIIKKKEKKITEYIDWILLTILIGLILYAYLNGYFYHNTIQFIEICNDIPINSNISLEGII